MTVPQKVTAHDIMHEGARCIGENESLQDAARAMRDLDVGAVPICGEDDRLKGMITDRDIAIRCCAEGRDAASMRASELAGEVHWIDSRADISEVLDMMERHQIKRLPVIDVQGNHRLVGIISEANLAQNLSDKQIAEFVGRVYVTH